MKGKHHIIIESKKLKYEFDIKRNITVIRGDSATGKTTLLELLSQHRRYSEKSGVRVEADVPCLVYAEGLVSWRDAIKAVNNSIIFIDEDFDFIRTTEFASVIKGTTNYYVLITRDSLKNLPYSIKEIYGIRNSGRFNYPEQIYNEFYPIYDEQDEICRCDKLIVEDSKSGYQFYSNSCGNKECISANGNSNIYTVIKNLGASADACIIADGAAFGAYIDSIVQLYNEGYKFSLYVPESFEWILLKAGIIDFADRVAILSTPEEYIDSAIYFSWERYFTDLIEKQSNGTIAEYHKDSLPEYYLNGKNKERILGVIPEQVWK